MPPPGFTMIDNDQVISRLPEIGLAAMAVYLVLRRRCNGEGLCWPAVPTIAQEAGVTSRTVRRAVQRLVGASLLEVEPRHDQRGVAVSNHYRVLPHIPRKQADTNDRVGGHKRQGRRTQTTSPTLTQTPVEQEPEENNTQEKAPATAGDIPRGLLELIDGWNTLGDSIVRKGNGAHRDPPAKAALSGWNRASRNPDQQEALQDIPGLLSAIRRAKYCHGKGWFTVPWLFGQNKNSEFNICRLLAGAHNEGNGDGKSQTSAVGPGQLYDPATASLSVKGGF